MIIDNEHDVTPAVLAEAARTPDARTREILLAGIAHLHAFVREARLTENEFRNLCLTIARLGQLTHASHNEVMLAAGSLGVSALVCLLNNGDGGRSRRHHRQPDGAVLARGLTAHRVRRLDRALADTGRSGVREGLGARPRGPAGRRAPRSTCGTPRPRATTRTRIRARPT